MKSDSETDTEHAASRDVSRRIACLGKIHARELRHSVKNKSKGADIPLGLLMGLSRSTEAMKAFGVMSEDQRNQVIQAASDVKTEDEMRRIVTQLEGGAQSGLK